jgi:hypothetical protein
VFREQRTRLLLIVCCAAVLIAGLSLGSLLMPSQTLPAVALGDVSHASIVEIRNQQGQAVLTGEFRSTVDMLGNTEKDAALYDQRGRKVIGEVEIETPAPGRTDRQPELEVDIIGLAPRQTFAVAIDNRIVASFTTDDRGSIDMELQEGEIPSAITGS